MPNKTFIAAVAIIGILAIAGVGYLYYTSTQQKNTLIIATTTSLYDSGLLDVIADKYFEKYNIRISFIAVGTGLALSRASHGDADLVFVHAPSLEAEFLASGNGVVRKIVAYNFFVIVGPKEDPAGINGTTPIEALKKIVAGGRSGNTTWVSRGDNSGTHVKELSLWKSAGFNVSEIREENWYIESGSGMGNTLLLANEKRAYTLSDMGTYLKYKAQGAINLTVLVSAGKELINVYSVIAVNPEVHEHINFKEAIRFIRFIVSREGQDLIGNYTVYNTPLFYPAVDILKNQPNSEIAQWIKEYAFINGSECPPQYRMGYNDLYN